jgi:hypothetical protein
MKKLIILIEIIIIISLLYLALPKAGAEEFITIGNVLVPYTAYYEMSGTASRVNSVLKLGQIIYVKGQFIEGVFTVEDTGYFRVKYLEGADPKDLTFDIYNLDFYLPTIEHARGFGIQYPIEVWVIGGE